MLYLLENKPICLFSGTISWWPSNFSKCNCRQLNPIVTDVYTVSQIILSHATCKGLQGIKSPRPLHAALDYEIEPAVWGRVGPTRSCSPRSTQPEGLRQPLRGTRIVSKVKRFKQESTHKQTDGRYQTYY